MEEVDVAMLLKDLKDFYVWKQFINDEDFIHKWIQDREQLIQSVPRAPLYK